MQRQAGRGRTWAVAAGLLMAGLLAALAVEPASAGPVENRIAVFAALDKITGGITTLEVPIDSEITFGTFHIRPRTCHTRPPTEQPRTMAFVEIDEYTYDNKHRRIFTGWMNAESPGLHAVEHPLFDVWLTSCRAPLQQQAADMPASPATSSPATGQGSTSALIPGQTDKAPDGRADALRAPADGFDTQR